MQDMSRYCHAETSASAAGSATLKAAFGTSLDTSSRLIKILPRFHLTGRLTADGLRLASAAAVGATDIFVLNNYIIRNGSEASLNPTAHDALSGLNGLASLRFEADVVIQDTFAHPID